MESKQAQRDDILVAEDDPCDRLLLQRAMEANGLESAIRFVEDGRELVDRLRETAESEPGGSLPALVLLDLNMPRMDGREALKIVKADPQLKRVPVVVLTTSSRREDVEGSYDAGANSFFTKPLEYKDLVALVDLLTSYWLEAARLPA